MVADWQVGIVGLKGVCRSLGEIKFYILTWNWKGYPEHSPDVESMIDTSEKVCVVPYLHR